MADEIDQNQEIAALRRENRLLLVKMKRLEATLKAELEVKEGRIENLMQKLDERDGTVNLYSGVYEATEKEARGLKRKLEEANQQKRKATLLYTVKHKLAKIQIKELQTKVSELKNKLEIQGNKISESLSDENEQVGGSSGVNAD